MELPEAIGLTIRWKGRDGWMRTQSQAHLALVFAEGRARDAGLGRLNLLAASHVEKGNHDEVSSVKHLRTEHFAFNRDQCRGMEGWLGPGMESLWLRAGRERGESRRHRPLS